MHSERYASGRLMQQLPHKQTTATTMVIVTGKKKTPTTITTMEWHTSQAKCIVTTAVVVCVFDAVVSGWVSVCPLYSIDTAILYIPNRNVEKFAFENTFTVILCVITINRQQSNSIIMAGKITHSFNQLCFRLFLSV